MVAHQTTPKVATPDSHFWLAELLVADGTITPEQHKSAIEQYRKDTKEGFGATLARLNLISSQRVAELIAQRAHLPLMHLDALTVPRAVARRLPEQKAKLRAAIPFRSDGGRLHIAIADDSLYPAASIRTDFPDTTTVLHVAAREDILGAINHCWTGNTQVTNPVEYFRDLVRRAIIRNASDIHIDPGEEYARIRFRIDGVLVHEAYITRDEAETVVRASKIEAGIDQHEKRIPQTGGFSMPIGSKNYSFRVETMPCHYGENSVTRIQADNAVTLTCDELGLSKSDQDSITQIMEIPNGVVLVTGPTGSGKSTLLNTMLHMINSTENKICTVEDPVEFPNPNFSQVKVMNIPHRDFASILRGFLRQDPDVMLVGEIRDKETAQIAVRASLTGHLCYATLHTNTAAAAVTRLVDIGIEPFLVASVLRGVIAVRLVRKVCPTCRRPHPSAETLRAKHGLKGEIYAGKSGGCPDCNHTGYKGRVGIFEILPLFAPGEDGDEFNEFVRQTISEKPGQEAEKLLVDRLRAAGRKSLRQDGLSKIEAGITTPEEVFSQT